MDPEEHIPSFPVTKGPSRQTQGQEAESVLEKRRKGYFNSLRRFNRQFEMAWKRLINRIRFRRAH